MPWWLETPAVRSAGCASAASVSPMTSTASPATKFTRKQSQDWCRFHTDLRPPRSSGFTLLLPLLFVFILLPMLLAVVAEVLWFCSSEVYPPLAGSDL